MEIISFEPFFHNNKEQVAISFRKSPSLNKVVKQVSRIKWSQSNKCWYLPLTKQHCQLAYEVLHEHGTIDIEPLRLYLQKRKKITTIQETTKKNPITP